MREAVHVLRNLGLGAALFCALGCEPQPLIHNTSVDLWCGDRPCHWEVQGRIERIGTWHERDYAVEFASEDAQLSQWNAYATAENASCYDFAMVAKVDEGVKLYLELDFYDDGEVEWSRPIPEGDWTLRTFLITAPTYYEGVRFILRKDGPGYAALAQLSAMTSSECSAEPIDTGSRPGGAPCEREDQCEFGTCHDGHCEGCLGDGDCGAGELCGLGRVPGSLLQLCVAEAGTPFGERCLDDRQCENGVCCQGVCSTCCEGAPCADGRTCGPPVRPAEFEDFGEQPYLPMQCAPGERLGAPSDRCTADTDCASGLCYGFDINCVDLCAHDGCMVCELKANGGLCQ